jgi:hypothetical protein
VRIGRFSHVPERRLSLSMGRDPGDASPQRGRAGGTCCGSRSWTRRGHSPLSRLNRRVLGPPGRVPHIARVSTVYPTDSCARTRAHSGIEAGRRTIRGERERDSTNQNNQLSQGYHSRSFSRKATKSAIGGLPNPQVEAAWDADGWDQPDSRGGDAPVQPANLAMAVDFS